jgi:hypothetical protein
LKTELQVPEAWGVVVRATAPVLALNEEAITVGVTLEAVG